ncbi:MAG: NTP transferase domain-containing protein [Azospirillum sp.]|nr:NTP transferase domain-containing protein [Azospirillum sp.]
MPVFPSIAPKRAMVLAAGLGLRMRPLTLERPKPLLEVAGRSLLDHALDRLAEAGVETAVVNAGYKREMIAAAVERRARPAIALSYETELLETGGGVRKALPQLGDEPFFVINADILWHDGPVPALTRLAELWRAETMDALLLLVPAARAFGYDGRGDYLADQVGRLTRRTTSAVAPFVYGGVQICSPGLFDETPDGRFSNNLVWDRAERAGRLYGMVHDGEWFHVGTPDALAALNRQLARPPRP